MAGKPVVTANKELLANARPRAVRDRRGRGRRPPVRGVGRGRHPADPPAARVARRRPHPPGDGHRQRHDQLHPHPHDRGRSRRSPTRSPRRRRSGTPSATPPPTSRASTPRRRPRSSPRSRSARASSPATCTARASPRSPPTTSRRPRDLGYVVKLLAVAEEVDGEVAVRVHPAMVPERHPLASVRDSFNAVFIEGDAVGELMLYGRGAGGVPTASAVLGDLIDAAKNLRRGAQGRHDRHARAEADPRRSTSVESQFYLLLEVADRPGVLARDRRRVRRARRVDPVDAAARHRRRRPPDLRHPQGARGRPPRRRSRALRDVEPVHRVGSVLRVMGDEE